jgi:hypothetical protein
MIIFGAPDRKYEWMPFTYTVTEHPCPTCQKPLTKVDVSTMLKCDQGHGPFFLV